MDLITEIPISPNITINKQLLKGLSNEEKVFEYLKQTRFPQIQKAVNYWSVFDFYSKKRRIEVKSRNNNHDKYPTTMVGLNKINHLKSYKYKGRFYFLFQDGLYYWDYKNHTKSRGDYIVQNYRTTNKEYAYISTNKLKLATKDITSL